jgi:hypothetical protein
MFLGYIAGHSGKNNSNPQVDAQYNRGSRANGSASPNGISELSQSNAAQERKTDAMPSVGQGSSE